MMKKLWIACLVMLVAGCSEGPFALKKEDRTVVAEEENVGFKIGVAVGNAAALDDNTWNAVAWKGIVQYVNRYPRTQLQRAVPKNVQKDALADVVEELLEVECDVIFGFGKEMAEIFEGYVKTYPEVTFILFQGEDLQPETANFLSISYEDQQSAFLAGVAAALNTASGQIGFIGGEPDGSVRRQSLGFEAGIGYANGVFGTGARFKEPEFAGSFDDPIAGRKLALQMYGDGVDVIFACARITTKGILEAAKILMEQDEYVWVIGVDSDIYDDGKGVDDRSVVLTSVVKNVDISVYRILEQYVRGDFPGGEVIHRTLAQGELGLPKENKNFNEKTKAMVAEVQTQITDGTLVIPYELEELEAFAKSLGPEVEG